MGSGSRITRFVKIVIGDTSDCAIGFFFLEIKGNRTRCNTGRE